MDYIYRAKDNEIWHKTKLLKTKNTIIIGRYPIYLIMISKSYYNPLYIYIYIYVKD